jgi:hypothetical protein
MIGFCNCKECGDFKLADKERQMYVKIVLMKINYFHKYIVEV